MACAYALAAAPSALADTVTSLNWAGYVAHRSGVTFRSAGTSWHVPAVSCQAGKSTYSAMWVGIGGYRQGSDALEQTGTESDCSAAGHASYYAWYELVPAPSRRVALPVRPGDLVRGEVDVVGHRVTVKLDNASEHHSLTRTQSAATVDATSADWIVEAPSRCGAVACHTLPLANFHRATFSSAHAVSSAGRGGSIAGSRWNATRIVLAPGRPRFISGGGTSAAGGATPSALHQAATAFSVSYQAGDHAHAARLATSPARVPGGRVEHPLTHRRGAQVARRRA